MVDVSELVVRAKPDGLDETTDGLENMEDSFDETAESVGDSADEMNNFSSKWAGAMGAIVAGLAVASAGLLAQVPVIGEAMSGLVAIIEAVAFQMDQVLRPILTPVTNLLFDASGAIFEMEGAVGDLVGIIGTLVATVVPIITILSRFGVISTGVVGILKGLGSIIVGIVSGSIGLAAIIGTIIGLFGVWVLEVTGVLDAIQGLGEWIGNQLPDVVRDGILTIIGFFLGPLAVIGGFITGFIEGGFSEGIERAKEIIDIFIGAAARLLSPLVDVLEGVWSFLTDIAEAIGDILGTAGNILGDIGDGILDFGGDVVNGSVDVATGGGGGGGGNTTQTTTGGDTYLDGRRLTEDTGRYRSDSTSRRGRFG